MLVRNTIQFMRKPPPKVSIITSFADTLSSLVIIANPDRRYGARNLPQHPAVHIESVVVAFSGLL